MLSRHDSRYNVTLKMSLSIKEEQHHRNKSADWSELFRRILTPTKFRRWTEEAGLGVSASHILCKDVMKSN